VIETTSEEELEDLEEHSWTIEDWQLYIEWGRRCNKAAEEQYFNEVLKNE
jgi:hypothetical protein